MLEDGKPQEPAETTPPAKPFDPDAHAKHLERLHELEAEHFAPGSPTRQPLRPPLR